MGKRVRLEIIVMVLFAGIAQAAPCKPSEMNEAQRWVAAKFGESTQDTITSGLDIVQHFDVVWRNCRVDQPLMLGTRAYHRGIFAHAQSEIRVKLPGPGATFTASVGVDTNSQTQGGKGTVVFTVGVGDKEEAFKSAVLSEGMPPVSVVVNLEGATEFCLRASDAGDGNSCDQADWVDAKVTMKGGSIIGVGDLPILAPKDPVNYTNNPPFSFKYGQKTFSELYSGWERKAETRELDGNRVQRELRYLDKGTGLEVRCVAVEYKDYPVIEWTVYLKNTGEKDTPTISDIQAIDTSFQREANDVYARFGRPGEFTLHHHVGSICARNDYEPLESILKTGETKELASVGGRGSDGAFPYFNLAWPGEGVMIAVGWPGQWRAAFARDNESGVRITAGQEKTHFTLLPGEEVRTPLMVLQFWKGDRLEAQNAWRRWMIAHNVPRPGGQLDSMHLSGCSSHFFGEMVTADEASQIQFIDRYREEKIPMDYWWMDAGWYVNKTGWPNTGTWDVDTKRFPRGLRSITDHAHSLGYKSIVWFEPERVTPGTWLYDTHPEWLLGKDGGQKLLNLGNPEAWQWLVDHVDKLLTEQGIDLYRQDFNMEPLPHWRDNDTEDRQGITENKHVTGYLAYWDELRRRHPNMLIDSCASGGRRNDLETMRRSVPLWRSDYILETIGVQGCTYGISSWIPFHGTGIKQADAYHFRSMMTPYPNCLWDARSTDLNYDELRRLTGQWKQVAPNYAGDYYPLTSYSLADDVWIGWQFDRPEAGEGMVQVFRRENSIYKSADLRLRGLDAEARYKVVNLDTPEKNVEVSGEDLLGKGLLVEMESCPGAVIYTYERIKE